MSDSEKPQTASATESPGEQPASAPPPMPAAAESGEKTDQPAKEQAGKQYRSAWQARSQTQAPPSKSDPQPESRPAPPPSPPPTRAFAEGPRIRDLDAQIDQEFKEMMSGLSEKDLFGEPAKAPPEAEPGAEPGRKKGRVVAIHGADVFVEVPGGRTQGLLPLIQFEEGTPALGTEVDVHIEGYDGAK